MKKHTGFILLSAAFGLLSANAATDCLALSLSVKSAASLERTNVLELVSREVAAAPGCACEIVKAAIEGSKADPKAVAAIVQAAITAAPEQMRLIARCAVAVAPDSRAAVEAVTGEVAADFNPLDFPGQGPVGPTPGGPGGMPLIPFMPPVNVIPPVVVPPVNVVPPVVVPPVVVPPVVVPNPPPVSPGNFPPGPPPGPPGPPGGPFT